MPFDIFDYLEGFEIFSVFKVPPWSDILISPLIIASVGLPITPYFVLDKRYRANLLNGIFVANFSS